MKKYLISDMDHTLLHEDGRLSKRTVDIVRNSPIELCLASARSIVSMKDFVQILHLTGPQVGLNGGIIFKLQNGVPQILAEYPFELDLAQRIKQFLQHNYPQVDFTWITRDHWYIPKMTTAMEEEMAYSGIHPVLNAELEQTAQPIELMFIIQEPEQFREVQSALRREFVNDGITIQSSGDGYLSLNAPGISKKKAVDYLISRGIKRSNLIGVGDDENDLPLLNGVGYSLAVNNARQSVKKVVDQVIASNDQDGIAKYLENTTSNSN